MVLTEVFSTRNVIPRTKVNPMQKHAVDVLKNPCEHAVPGMVVLTGKERFIKLEVLKWLKTGLFGIEGMLEAGDTTLRSKGLDFISLADELRMVSMWQSIKLVIVEDADEFVSSFRSQLESYAKNTAKKSVLVLDVTTWPATTKLAKIVKETGWTIECQELAGQKLIQWIIDWAKLHYKKSISGNVAQLIVDLVGASMGLIEREISKLADYTGERNQITQKDVEQLVGGWKTETTWTMLNAVRDQEPGIALEQLHQLLKSGEPPMKILGGINFVFRKYAEATQLVYQGVPLPAALTETKFFPRDIEPATRYLKRLGRERASQITKLLHDADLNFKGGVPCRIRFRWSVC
jgi:DNA polymerase III subunit delta